MDILNLEAFRYKSGKLLVLDQLKLPLTNEYIQVENVKKGWEVINKMQVRGAPAIGIAALLSLAVELFHKDVEGMSPKELGEWTGRNLDYLVTSRPTGVNLRIECSSLKDFIETRLLNQTDRVGDLKKEIIGKCEELLPRDVRDNKVMGQFGANHILLGCDKESSIKILTHCNTGSLATGGYGTALGVIRALQDLGRLHTAFCTETRPYNQGSRLTAYELTYDRIPAKLICDSAVSALFGSEKIDAVVVGADRIARNGDTANKIGTYQIAISAKYHGIPFYIAAPTATIDLQTLSGKDIPIEDRPGDEIIQSSNAPKSISCWNPAFDVTPADLITGGIITEKGVVKAPLDSLENLKTLELTLPANF